MSKEDLEHLRIVSNINHQYKKAMSTGRPRAQVNCKCDYFIGAAIP